MNFQEVEAALRRVHGDEESAQFRCALVVRLYVYIAKGLMDISNGALRPFELNRTSFSTLMMLYSSVDNSLNPSLVCDITGESRANMTRISDELVERGLIRRAPSSEDRRRQVLSIQPAGRRLVRKLLPLLWDRVHPMFEPFDEAELKQLTGLLKRQAAKLDESR